MKKIKLIMLPIILGLAACKTNTVETSSSSNRVEITPFIETMVVIMDTNSVKNIYLQNDSGNISMAQYADIYEPQVHFLNNQQFEQFKNALRKIMNDPKQNVYLDDAQKPLDKKQVFDRIVDCDSVKMSSFDAKGEEYITTHWNCDSISRINRISRIKFYETWYFNSESKMIEKEMLGYSLLGYSESKRSYRPLFFVFKDAGAAAKAKKYNAMVR